MRSDKVLEEVTERMCDCQLTHSCTQAIGSSHTLPVLGDVSSACLPHTGSQPRTQPWDSRWWYHLDSICYWAPLRPLWNFKILADRCQDLLVCSCQRQASYVSSLCLFNLPPTNLGCTTLLSLPAPLSTEASFRLHQITPKVDFVFATNTLTFPSTLLKVKLYTESIATHLFKLSTFEDNL